jgi:hypothetical protein
VSYEKRMGGKKKKRTRMASGTMMVVMVRITV